MNSRSQSRNERGAALLEFALVAPILILLVFGIVEYGMFFKDYLTVSNTTRAGARVGSAAGSGADADYQIIQSVKAAAAALPGGANSIERITIFRSTSAGGGPTTTCQTTSSAADRCNVYTATALNQPVTRFGCGPGSLDSVWCPTTRQDSQAIGPDYIGVWIKTTHGFITKLFGTSRTITDSVVMRIEPKMP
ncbi:MAG TPA: TadE/TadG family type IV pilus assembly protein [Acidimicrobiia bacterium]|nr:TadE/TadG family type IV pilus assembly protein [Acidimicrobiia bacterium]